MKVLLTHGYFLHQDAAEQTIMRPYPPLGLLYLSAYLQQKGVENSVFDSTFSTLEKLQAHLLDTQPKYICLYTNLVTKLTVLQLIQFIVKQDALRYSKIILGGPDVTYNVENYLRAGADMVVIGEGEQTLSELISALDLPMNPFLDQVPGIAFINALGEVVQTSPREKMKNIDALPVPHRAAIDLALYRDVWRKHHGQSTLSISTQRGCPYTCRWCSTAVYGQSYRRRSPANVADEMVGLKKEYNPDSLWFVDDVFTVSHNWIADFRRELALRELRIPFECITRADRLNAEVMSDLKRAGCFRVWIGAESGSQKIIDAMDRRVKVSQVGEMIRLAKLMGMEAGTFIMVGYPGETEADICQTLQHLKQSNPDRFTITLAYPIKGTALYKEVENQHIQPLNWRETTDRDIDFKRTYPRRYYDFAIRWIVNEVNYHQAKRAGRHWLPRGLMQKAIAIAARIGMRWHRGV